MENDIIALAGQFKNMGEISHFLHEKYRTKTKSRTVESGIYRVITRKASCINVLKETYAKAIMEVPIAHKRVRLERLEELYQDALKNKKSFDARAVLTSAREELEGVRTNLNLYQLNFFGGMSDAELAQREREIIKGIQSLAGGESQASEKDGVSVLPAPSEAEVISSV